MTLKSTDLQALPIPTGLVLFWGGTAASIPTNWAADSSLTGGYYLRGATAGANPSGGGGSSSHTHSFLHGGGSGTVNNGRIVSTGGGGNGAMSSGHTHSLNNDTPTSDAAGNSPPYFDVLPIKYGATPSGKVRLTDLLASCFPTQRTIGVWTGTLAAIPTGWALCDGTAPTGMATPNLIDRYARGVVSTGTLPNTTGGTDAHGHVDAHTHSLPGIINNVSFGWGPSGNSVSDGSHTHAASHGGGGTSSGSVDPLHKKVAYVMFVGHGTGGLVVAAGGKLAPTDLDVSLLIPRGMILGHYRTDNTIIPSGHQAADGGTWNNGTPSGYGAARPNLLDRFLRMVNTVATNAGATGGSASTHGHGGGSHAHGNSTPTLNADSNTGDNGGAGPIYSDGTHGHSIAAAALSLNAQATVPLYQLVQWIVRD